jgi:hypothetical protein
MAADPALMLQFFLERLQPATGKHVEIRTCAPVRLRFRHKGSRCSVQYALELLNVEEHRPVSTWVTAALFAEPGEAEAKWKELRAADAVRVIPETLMILPPLTFIPEFRMLLHVFPYDHFLPNVPQLMIGIWPELQEQLLTCFGSGDWSIQQHNVRALRHLPEENTVLRYSIQARRTDDSTVKEKRFYVKTYRTRQGEQTYAILRQLEERASPRRNEFSIVKPLFYSAERRYLVLEEAPGRSLQEELLSGTDAIAATRRVAHAMAAFNTSDVPLVTRRSAANQIDFLTRTADLLRWACPDCIPSIDAIVREVISTLRDVPGIPIQWDPKPDHVFLDDERITFIDLDDVCLGDPARDPAHMAAQIVCRIDLSEMPVALARTAADALIEEYFAHVPAEWREQFDLQYTIALLETACGFFKRQEARWAERATAAIQEIVSIRRI